MSGEANSRYRWPERLALLGLGVVFLAMHIATLPSSGRAAPISTGEATLAVLFAGAAIWVLVMAAIGRGVKGPGGLDSRTNDAAKNEDLRRGPPKELEVDDEELEGKGDAIAEGEPLVQMSSDIKPAPEVEEKAATVTVNDKLMKVYPLELVPVNVLFHLVEKWREAEFKRPKPYNFSDFDYAARKEGPGNNAWFIRFKTGDAYWVGFGRGGVAITPANPPT